MTYTLTATWGAVSVTAHGLSEEEMIAERAFMRACGWIVTVKEEKDQ